MTTRSPGRITKAQSRKAAKHWRVAEKLLSEAVALLIRADGELLAGELATRHRDEVKSLIDDARNIRSNVGYAAGEEERSAAR